jgi:glycosyltransferase involved in cell wall biosynthesis
MSTRFLEMYSKSRRVIFMCNDAWSFYNFRYSIVRHLKEKDFDVTLLVPPHEVNKQFQKIGCEVECCEFSNSYSPVKLFKDARAVARVLKKHPSSMSIIYTIKPLVALGIARALGMTPGCAKTVAVVPGLGRFYSSSTLLSKYVRRFHARVLQSCSSVVVLNETDKNELIDASILDANIHIFPGEGLEQKWFEQPRNLEQKFSAGLLYAGRIFPQKGVDVLLDLAESGELPLPLTLAGAIEDEGLRSRITKLSECGLVTYVGFTSDIAPIVNRAKYVILPTRYREGCPRILMEALAMGTPVLASRFPGYDKLVVEGETGFVCDAFNTRSVLQAIHKANALSIEKYGKLSLSASSYAKKEFADETVNKLYEQILEL